MILTKFVLGGVKMIEKITEFFRNLPPKRCRDCENAIEEQHECYGNTCNNCLNIK